MKLLFNLGDRLLEPHRVDVAAGSLGQGLPDGVGVALAGKYLERLPYRVWVLCGDSELAEGSIWEALDKASYYQLSNCLTIIRSSPGSPPPDARRTTQQRPHCPTRPSRFLPREPKHSKDHAMAVSHPDATPLINNNAVHHLRRRNQQVHPID